jgi:hypothetical protein
LINARAKIISRHQMMCDTQAGGARPESAAVAVAATVAVGRADVTMNVKGRLLMTERFCDLRTQPVHAPEAAALIGVLFTDISSLGKCS